MGKIKKAISSEINETSDDKLLFRMDTKATKRIISFIMAVGFDYLETVLGPIIRGICEDQLCSYEVNSRLLEASDSRDLNIDRLRSISTVFNRAVLDSTKFVPLEFCELFRHVQTETQRKWNTKETCYKSIGGLFFLRFINAAIVSPASFGLVQGVMPTRPQRCLILVSKILQYIVNSNTFDPSHELYEFNSFVTSQIPLFVHFIDGLLARLN